MTKPYEPMPEDWERALCVVAHPDDLEYGPACAVARWTTQGKFVAYAVASRGEAGIATMAPDAIGAMRAGEQLRAAAVVGVRDVDFLGHPDGIIEYGLPLRRDLARSIRKYRPDVLVTINFCERWRSGDWNTPDHRNVGVALLDAAADAGYLTTKHTRLASASTTCRPCRSRSSVSEPDQQPAAENSRQ